MATETESTFFTRSTVMLLCSSIRESTSFYCECLELDVTIDIGWFVGLKQRGGPYELSLCEADHDSVPSSLRRPSDGVVLAFQVKSVDVSVKKLSEAGVKILVAPVDEPWGQRRAVIAAPDGVALDLFEPIDPNPNWLKANKLA